MAALDKVFRKILINSFVKSTFFSRGWGTIESYESLARMRQFVADGNDCDALVTPPPTVHLSKKKQISSHCDVYSGHFRSPVSDLAPNVLPAEAETARFELVVPRQRSSGSGVCPMYIHLAGTGDHYFWRRRLLTADPLLKEAGIGALLLENPFYGSRKPKAQVRSYLLHVSDLMIMGLAVILDCLVLYHWLKREGFGPLGITGLSMGGHNAALSSTLWPEPHALVPCISWTTAANVFTEGLLSDTVAWPILHEQMSESRRYNGPLWRLFMDKLPIGDLFSSPAGAKNSCCRGLEREECEHYKTSSCDCVAHNAPTNTSHDGLRKEETLQSKNLTSFYSRLKAPYLGTVRLMDALLDYSTHLRHYQRPVDGSTVVFVAARGDNYVLRQDDIHSVWPNSDVCYVNGGHVSTTIFKQKFIRSVLQESMNKQLATKESTVPNT